MVNGGNSTLEQTMTDGQENYDGPRAAHCINDASFDSSELCSESQRERGGDSDSDIEEAKNQLFADLGPETIKKWAAMPSEHTALVSAQAGA